jgi:hypothetical protein
VDEEEDCGCGGGFCRCRLGRMGGVVGGLVEVLSIKSIILM